MDVRRATAADAETLTECIALAFAEDPIWSIALRRGDGRTDHVRPYWQASVEAALRFETVFVADEGAAVAVWIPPGEEEFSDDQATAIDVLVERSLDPRSYRAIHELYDRFSASRAGAPGPHAYLSLLATHPAHRGRGIGQALLAANLTTFDAKGTPAYLESTNPANDHRYERAGFRRIGGFGAVLDDARVTAMWRPVGGAGGV